MNKCHQLYIISSRNNRERVLPNSFYGARVIFIPKPDKDSMKKKKEREKRRQQQQEEEEEEGEERLQTNILHEHAQNIFSTKYYQNESSNILKKITQPIGVYPRNSLVVQYLKISSM